MYERVPNSTANMTVLVGWKVERIHRIAPSTLDAIFAALIDAARTYPTATIKVWYGPEGVGLEVFMAGRGSVEDLLRWRGWEYDYPA